MDRLKWKNMSKDVLSYRLRKNERLDDNVCDIAEQLSPTVHRLLLSDRNPSHTGQTDMRQLRLETKSSSVRLPPLNPDKNNLITSSNSLNQPLRYSPQKRQDDRKYSSRPEVHGETSIGRTPVVPRTTRLTENTDVTLSSFLGPVLNSGSVHYKCILPPIGETYKIRIKDYYPIFAQKESHSDDGEFNTFYDGEVWIEDMFEKMKSMFVSQDDILRTFFCSASCHRRGATCCELDSQNGTIGAVEFMRQKLISEILFMYYL